MFVTHTHTKQCMQMLQNTFQACKLLWNVQETTILGVSPRLLLWPPFSAKSQLLALANTRLPTTACFSYLLSFDMVSISAVLSWCSSIISLERNTFCCLYASTVSCISSKSQYIFVHEMVSCDIPLIYLFLLLVPMLWWVTLHHEGYMRRWSHDNHMISLFKH